MQRRISTLLIAATIIASACASKTSPGPGDAGPNPAASATSTSTSSSGAPPQNAETVMPERVQAAFERNCKSCHGPEGSGIKGVGPDLRLAKQKSLQEWIAYLKDPRGTHSSTRIPAMASLDDADFEALGGYLADLSQNNK